LSPDLFRPGGRIRCSWGVVMGDSERPEATVRFGVFEVDPRSGELRKSGTRIRLQDQPFKVLLALLERPGDLVTREELRIRIWPQESFGDFDHAVNIAVAKLRAALADSAEVPRYIETLYRRGYRFIFPIGGRPVALTPDKIVLPPFEFDDSIAVLPFENAGRDPEIEYLSDGITETVINNLSRLEKLRVVPRSTVFRYKGKMTDPVKIGRELRARLVLTGHIIQRGRTLIIGTELIDTARESQLWGGKFKREVSETIDVMQQIAEEVSKRLQLKLSNQESAFFSQRPTQNREAYLLFLRAMHQANKWTPEGRRKGIEFARQAIEADPAYAAPHSVLAYIYGMLGYVGVLAPADAFPKSRAAALRALQIDETDVRAQVWLGLVKLFYDWDWQGAEIEICRALYLGANDPASHFAHGVWLLAMGRCEESILEMKQAIELDPLSSRINAFTIAAYSAARQHDNALEQCRKTLELDPTFVAARAHLAALLARLGRSDEAIAEAQKFYTFTGGDVRGKSTLGMVYAIAGRGEEARKIAQELESQAKPANLASALPYIYATLGDRDRAFYWLEEAYLARVSELVFISHAPDCDGLRGDPRFEDLLRRIGLPGGSGARSLGHRSEHDC
jgi:TolB-like protein/DNA-binding winged helix-turn-helix (wHTH) protein/Flp pilus assembly protein TadD